MSETDTKKTPVESTEIDDNWESNSKETNEGLEPQHAENRDSADSTPSMGVAKAESRQAQMAIGKEEEEEEEEEKEEGSTTTIESPPTSQATGKRRAATEIDNYMERAKRIGILEKSEVPAELLNKKRPASDQQSGPQTFRTDDRAALKDSTGEKPVREEHSKQNKKAGSAEADAMNKAEMVNEEGHGQAKEMESRLARDRAARGQYDANARTETGRGGNFQVGEEGKIFDDWNGKSKD